MTTKTCPIHNKPLITWYVLGGKTVLGCPNIKCDYQLKEPKKLRGERDE